MKAYLHKTLTGRDEPLDIERQEIRLKLGRNVYRIYECERRLSIMKIESLRDTQLRVYPRVSNVIEVE